MRTSGILLPVFSLPSKYGIGCFSVEAMNFINFLARSGQKYWQILPLVPPGACESPYQSVSTFAGNPMFIDLEQLVSQELITQEELDSFDWDNSNMVNYEKVKVYKSELLRRAYEKSDFKKDKWYIAFCKENEYWLDEYALYMSIKEGLDIDYYKFEQFEFDMQWRSIKAYANFKGIEIIGDLPIYVSLESADVYHNPELFELNEDMSAKAVAGCPSDDFSDLDQIWGNPLYDWNKHKETNYEWWIKRIRHCFKLHDVVRLDHFRGFYDYYSIPADRDSAKGEWKLGPGIDLFNSIKKSLGNVKFIAEDLGFLSPGVHELMRATGFPGMKILQFAFNSGKDNPYLPENISENYIVYTGTHDNNTTLGWYNNATDWEREHLKQYIPDLKDVSWDLIELAMSTKANTCIIQMQDYLGLDGDCRTNTPGTININWMWRMTEMPSIELSYKIRELSRKYNRL